MKKFRQNETGIAHLYLILLFVLVVAGVGFGVKRVMDANKVGGDQVSQKQDSADEALNKTIDSTFSDSSQLSESEN